MTHKPDYLGEALREERERDRLIAAAPELLEALEQCITADGAVGMRNIEYARKRLNAISETARAAIAKAKGE